MSAAAALDHVGVVGRDLAVLAEEFAALGFTLTPLARHAGGRTGNRCIMLRGSYIELLAVLPGGASATLERFLARYAGIHILALGIDDVAAARERLRRAGLEAAASETERLVDDADPAGPRARFTLLTPPDLPEGRVHLVRHAASEALWQPRFLGHANHAVALAELLVVAAVPAETAARLSRISGRPVLPDPAGGYALGLPTGRVRMLPPEAFAAVLPGAEPPALPGGTSPVLPWIAGLVVATDDDNAALRAILDARGFRHRVADGAVVVQAGGIWLRFVADGSAASA